MSKPKETKMQITVARHMRLPPAILAALAAVSLSAHTALIEQGRDAISRGDSDAAIDILEKAVAQSPESAEAHFYLASAYASKVQDRGMFGAARYASKVKDQFEKAVARNPKYVEARFGLVQFYAGAPGIMGGSAVYENEGKKAEAKQSYQAALKLNPALERASEALKRVS